MVHLVKITFFYLNILFGYLFIVPSRILFDLANILQILFTDDIKHKYPVTKHAETATSDLMEPHKYPGTVSVASAIKAMK